MDDITRRYTYAHASINATGTANELITSIILNGRQKQHVSMSSGQITF